MLFIVGYPAHCCVRCLQSAATSGTDCSCSEQLRGTPRLRSHVQSYQPADPTRRQTSDAGARPRAHEAAPTTFAGLRRHSPNCLTRSRSDDLNVRVSLGETLFARFHLMMQRRFGAGLDRGEACIGRAVKSEIRRRPWWIVPFLQIGRYATYWCRMSASTYRSRSRTTPTSTLRRRDSTFVRAYTVSGRRRRFDATMILTEDRIVDYLGTHQHLAVDPDLTVDEDGGLVLASERNGSTKASRSATAHRT